MIAYITSYGRIKLFEDRLKFQDAIYCDTDSCVTVKDYDINRGKELGNWDLNKYNNFRAYAPKFYTKNSEEFELKLKEFLKITYSFIDVPKDMKKYLMNVLENVK